MYAGVPSTVPAFVLASSVSPDGEWPWVRSVSAAGWSFSDTVSAAAGGAAKHAIKRAWRFGDHAAVHPPDWGGSDDPSECSDGSVGRRVWGRIHEPPELFIRQVIAATLTCAGNWG